MLSIVAIAWWALCVASAASGVLLTLQTWEHCRFAARRRARPCETTRGRVALFAPCKGLDIGLEENIRRLLTQDHPNYEATFIVESRDDPALRVIRSVMEQYPRVDARILVAGRSSTTGQKVYNLRQATSTLSPEVEFLAFVDSDGCAESDWLRRLVQCLDGRADATTGYRWFLPSRTTLPNLILHSINASVAALFGPGGHYLAWGGSWAIRRDVFEREGLWEEWSGALSDDLTASRLLRARGCVVRFEPSCVLGTKVDYSYGQMCEFLRRQYVMGRHCMRRWLFGAIGWVGLATISFWGTAVWLVAEMVSARDERNVAFDVSVAQPATILAVLYALTVLRVALRARLAQIYLGRRIECVRWAIVFDLFAQPVAALVNMCSMVSAFIGNTVVWRGHAYELQPGGKVRVRNGQNRLRPQGWQILDESAPAAAGA